MNLNGTWSTAFFSLKWYTNVYFARAARGNISMTALFASLTLIYNIEQLAGQSCALLLPAEYQAGICSLSFALSGLLLATALLIPLSDDFRTPSHC